MLKIRDEQLAAFSLLAQQEFEKALATHVREFAPKHAEVLGDAGTLQVVRMAIQRGEAYGFTGVGPLQLFLDLMFLFGSEFDSDFQYPWAARILAGSPAGQMDRADRLHAAAMDYLDKVAGPENEFAKAGLRAIRSSGPALIRDGVGDFTARATAALHQIYPQKADHLGMERVKAVVERGVKESMSRSITGTGGIWLIVALDYALGHAITRDPLYPWVGHTLNDLRFPDPNERAKKLYQKTMTYLDSAIGYLEAG
jgi:hypothetical protein